MSLSVLADEPVEPEFENTNLLIKVVWFDTIEELQIALDDDEIEAYSECEIYPEETGNIGFCEIWVVRAKYVDDDNHSSLGHEVDHGLHGSYHEE